MTPAGSPAGQQRRPPPIGRRSADSFSREDRLKLGARAGWQCELCGEALQLTNSRAPNYLIAGHIVSHQDGGKPTLANGRAECKRCSESSGATQGNERARSRWLELEERAERAEREVQRLESGAQTTYVVEADSLEAGAGTRRPPSFEPLPSAPETLSAATDLGSMWRESTPADFAGIPWLKGLLRPPADAVWPRFMSAPHPDAVGSYGAVFAEFARKRTGKPLDWWQRLASARLLEHNAAGELVWGEWLLTVARQIGKSWLVRELILWRLTLERKIGEPQEILYVANKLRIADKIQRPARAWAEAQEGWAARHSNGSQSVSRGESLWTLSTDVGAYGLSTSLAVVDEGWDVAPEHIADGITPTLLERRWSQLALISTAHHRCTSLFVDRRLGALTGDGTLLLEWSGRPWLELDDRAGWRQASPRWTSKREALIERELARALAGRNPGADPLSFFRSQYLNQWPTRATAGAVIPGIPFLPESVWASLAGDAEIVGAIVFAVEDIAGRAAAVAAAGRAADGRIVLECYEVADRSSAFHWAGMHAASHPGSRMAVGTALQNDPSLAELAIPTDVMSYADTKASLSALRTIVSRRELMHANSPTLADQLGSLRLATHSSAGLRVISGDPWDLVRPAAWAVSLLDRYRGSGVWVA